MSVNVAMSSPSCPSVAAQPDRPVAAGPCTSAGSDLMRPSTDSSVALLPERASPIQHARPVPEGARDPRGASRLGPRNNSAADAARSTAPSENGQHQPAASRDALFERPRLFEKVRRSRNDDEIDMRTHALHRGTIERDHRFVCAADDQQRRCLDTRKYVPARSGRPPRETRTRTGSGRSAAALSAAAAPVLAPNIRPAGRQVEPTPAPSRWRRRLAAPASHVEPVLAGPRVDGGLRRRQQIEQERGEPVCRSAGHCTIAALKRLLPLPCANTTSPAAGAGITRSPSISTVPALTRTAVL